MRKSILAVACVAMLSGCASQVMKDIDEGVGKADAAAVHAVEALRTGKPADAAPSGPVIRRVDKTWVPVSKAEEEPDYKAAASLNRQVVVVRRLPAINEAATYITSLTGIPVMVSGIAQSSVSGAGPAGLPVPGMPLQQPVPGQGFPGQGGASSAAMLEPVVTYSGKLSGFLDVVAAKFNVFWEWDRDAIRFYKTKSRTFRLAALPGDASMSSKVGTQSSGASTGATSSSSSAQSSGVEFSGLSIWKGVEDSIKTMLTADGKVVVTPATGTITVDDTPPSLERVARFIEDQNAALSRQVVLNVRVLSVDLSDSDNYGINWNAIYKNLGRGFSVGLASSASPVAGATGITFNVVNTNSMWDGTQLMLEALSKQGKVSQITSASLATINNQPAPIQVGRQTSYLASSTTTLGTGGAGNTTTLTPGTVTTGFSMSVLPHILDNGKMMLQYAGDISSLVNIVTVTSGGSSIQTPEIDTRNFLQRVMMNSGETLVLTGFEQFNLSGTKQGVGSADNIALGGSVKTSNNKNVLVVLIQPIMMGNP